MGRYLQIRVSASTFREEEVLQAWPRLTTLVWPDGPVGPEGGGVLQLVAALDDACNFAGWNDTLRKALAAWASTTSTTRATRPTRTTTTTATTWSGCRWPEPLGRPSILPVPHGLSVWAVPHRDGRPM